MFPLERSALIVLAACATGHAVAAQDAVHRRPWPHEVSDLPPDPALHFAELDNGLRLVWVDHAVPPARCALRLIVHVGSVDEGDDERGMAHFVEHMAFNGTRRFPGTSIEPWFQAQGMAVGRDVNAATSFEDTTFDIDLARSDTAALTEGLEVLCDFATGILFDPEQVEAEKGVVDAEERERSSPEREARDARKHRLMAGSRLAERRPIGLREQRARFDADSLRAFHRRWYRPDNMTLVIVGDLRDVDALSLTQQTCGRMPAPTEPFPQRADRGEPTLEDMSFAIEQRDRVDVAFLVQRLQRRPPGPMTAETWREYLRLRVACEMARWQLADRAKSAESPLRLERLWPVGNAALQGVALEFECAPEQCANAMGVGYFIETATRAFTPALLEAVRASEINDLDAWAEATSNASSSALADEIASRLAHDQVAMSPAFVTAEARKTWEALDAESCAERFRSAWSSGELSITSIGPRPADVDPVATWHAGQARAQADPPSPPPASEQPSEEASAKPAPDWRYAIDTTQEAPQPVSRVHDARLDLEDVRFPNGVRLLIKRTDFAKDEILVSACLGSGMAAVGEEKNGLVKVCEAAFPSLGLTGVSPRELRSLCSTRRVGVELIVDRHWFALRGATNRASQQFEFELFRAHCTRQGWSSEGLDLFTRSYAGTDQRQEHSFAAATERFLDEIGPRTDRPSEAELLATRIPQLRSFLGPVLRKAPMTVVVVGDLDIERTISLAAATFGRVFVRRSEDDAPAPGFRQLQGGVHASREVETSDTRSLVCFFVGLPRTAYTTDDFAMRFLREIVTDRLHARVREEMGEAYAPVVALSFIAGRVESALLGGFVMVAPGNEQRVLDACLEELDRLAERGVDEAELERQRAPILTKLRTDRQTNASWVKELAQAHSDPDALTKIVELLPRWRAVTAAEVTRAAAEYLRRDATSTLVLRPKSPR